ncbi:hypothetical protein [Conexibacter woesei]|uniref:Uncharacterized protein n=1 Tax=Conexibacter woesei (strain DSM 14684 / CCUG 47730 / CIP 108061 / JCM 11494 / NBRC 100937 / ID131577) TaxID=469383 RepID=D3EZ97_CONWI|nr:hypothetical protein [Conexibacter woesei]ADB51862.1 hypothetical protein Cwoe_3444 [Conexibacter woesei DSM 14684]
MDSGSKGLNRDEGELRLAMRDGRHDSQLLLFAELREALVPRLARRLGELGHVVRRIEVPSDARPYPGSRFACDVETDGGVRLTVHCELRPRRLRPARVGRVRYVIAAN